MQYKMERAQNEAEQCIAFDGQNNPCLLKQVPGTSYCPKHGVSASAQEKVKIRNYRLTVLKGRLTEKMSSDAILSLREEVSIARITLEETLNQCKSATEIVIQHPRIVSLITTIQRTVESCQKVEMKTGHLLGKDQLINFAQDVIRIVSTHVTDPEVQRLIAAQIVDSVESLAIEDDE